MSHDIMRQGTSKGTVEFIFYWLSAADHEMCPEEDISKWLSIGDCF